MVATEESIQGALLLFALPIVAIACLSLNLLIRARGRRSFKLELRAFGVEIKLESGTPSGARGARAIDQQTEEVTK